MRRTAKWTIRLKSWTVIALPYLVAVVLPGGILIALAFWIHRSRQGQRMTRASVRCRPVTAAALGACLSTRGLAPTAALRDAKTLSVSHARRLRMQPSAEI
jgi:hypothetical protein